ncbi:hypothetical protein BT69DRAFT_1330571 [Atractiella rhizophila]|nr:hypothetical protein BT69DRAFT_1330571 [Atractiella rhizophila]
MKVGLVSDVKIEDGPAPKSKEEAKDMTVRKYGTVKEDGVKKEVTAETRMEAKLDERPWSLPNEGEQRITYSRRLVEVRKEKFKVADRGLQGYHLPVDCRRCICTLQTVYLVKDGGTYVQVGMGIEFVQVVPVTDILTKEVIINGSFRSNLPPTACAITLF